MKPTNSARAARGRTAAGALPARPARTQARPANVKPVEQGAKIVAPKPPVAHPGVGARFDAIEAALRDVGALLRTTPPGPGGYDELAIALGERLSKLGR